MKRKINNDNLRRRKRRAYSIRKKIEGTVVRPRLTVFRSNHHIYAQVIDDGAGKTLAASSTRVTALKGELSGLKKSEAAELVGKKIAENAYELYYTKLSRPGILNYLKNKLLSL